MLKNKVASDPCPVLPKTVVVSAICPGELLILLF